MLRLPNLIGYWRLRGDGHDESGNGRDMLSQNISWVEDGGITVASFNGTSSCFYTGSQTWGDVSGSDFSVAAWVKTTADGDGVRMVFGRSASLDGARNYDFWTSPAEYQTYYNTVDGSKIFTASSIRLVWKHITLTVESGTARHYINATLNSTEFPALSGPASGSNINFIGASVGGGGYWLKGLMKDVVNVRSSLTQVQITALYQGEKVRA